MPTRNIPTRRRRAIVGGVAVALLGSGTAGAAVANAAPAANCPATTTLVSWHGATLTGVQYGWGGGRQTRFTFNADNSVDWSVAGVGDRTYRTMYSQYKDTVHFRSEIDRGFGQQPIDIALTAEQCDATGHVTQARAETFVSESLGRWYILRTKPGEPLRSTASADKAVE
jgi:hypothetical protein